MPGEGQPAAGQGAAPHTKRPVVLVYPTVSPETVVVPIVSCIFGFPLLALLVICCLRRRAKIAREQARRRACERGVDGRSSGRGMSFRGERSMSRGFPSLELDTVVEEPDHTVIETMTPDEDNEEEEDRKELGEER